MSCDRCPCPETCLALPAYCRWAAEEPPDTIRLRHICEASRRPRPAPDDRPATARPTPTPVRAATPPADAGRPPVHESLALTRSMNRCDFRSTKGCGCSGARCALRGGAIVSHVDCFDCLRRYPEWSMPADATPEDPDR